MKIFAIIWIVLAFVSAAVISCDLVKRPQRMRIMNSVWVLTSFWAGLFALWAYFGFGRAAKKQVPQDASHKDMRSGKSNDNMTAINASMPGMKNMQVSKQAQKMPSTQTMKQTQEVRKKPESIQAQTMSNMHQMPDMSGVETDTHDKSTGKMSMQMPTRPRWQGVALSTLHCGAGCTLADITGETFVYLVPVYIGGSVIFGGWVIDYILALLIGIFFQYIAIRSMQNISPGKAVVKAAKADLLSLTAWQVGMYGWMALVYFVFFRDSPLSRLSWEFWFMMQVAMMFGFLFSLPMNLLLIRAGIKKSM